MKTGCVRWKLLVLGLALASAGSANANPATRPASWIYHVPIAGASSLYELSDPAPLSSARWDPLFESRLELSAGLLPRHEVRLAATSRAGGWVGSDMTLRSVDSGFTTDPLRATYRYTFFARPDWAWKVGVTTRLGDIDPARSAALGMERARLSGMPLVHLAGQGRLAEDWLLTVDADGLLTPRGRALDIGVRVNYALTRSIYLFGGYRLTDHYLEGEEGTPGLTNSANVGVRYRF